MTAEQVKSRIFEAVWNHFNKWVAKETCLLSEDRKGHKVLEYLDWDVDKYLENLFLPRVEGIAAPALTAAMVQNKIEFSLEAPSAHSVTVAGDFNDWCPIHTPLQRGGDGTWRVKVSLSLGRHEYMFVVDGQWRSDPKAQESIPNIHGGRNSVVVV